MKEDIQRDIVIETDPIGFNIPIRTNLEDTLPIADLQSTVDLSAQITKNTNQFTIADLRSAYITKFTIKLDNPDTEINTIGAFSAIKVELKATNKPLIQIGEINNISSQSTDSLSVTITEPRQQLQEYLSAGMLTYVISGVSRNATTKVIQAKAVAGYKLTLGM